MTDKIGNILLCIALLAAIVLIIVSSIKLFDSVVYRDDCQPNIEYYEDY